MSLIENVIRYLTLKQELTEELAGDDMPAPQATAAGSSAPPPGAA